MNLIIPMVLILALAFVSCQKIERQYLQGVDKDIVPYQWGDSYRFVDGKNDTATLTVRSVEDRWEIEGDDFMEVWQQYRKISLSSDSGDIGLSFVISGQAYGGNRNKRAFTFILEPSGFGTIIEYNSSGRFIQDTDSYWYQQVYDSLLIGNQMYHNVAERIKPESYKAYYNKASGVLQVKIDDKVVFRRIP